MIAMEDSRTTGSIRVSSCPQTRHFYYYTPPPSPAKFTRTLGRSMRTIRSNLFQAEHSPPIPENSPFVSENLTDSVIDFRLGELASKTLSNSKSLSPSDIDDALDFSCAFSDLSACSSDVSGDLQRLSALPNPEIKEGPSSEIEPEPEPCPGFLDRETFSTEIIESISPEDLQPTVKLCVDGLQSSSIALKKSAAAKLRLLAKNRADNRALIGESGAIPAIIPLLRSSDPGTQEEAVTALFNISLHESNKKLIMNSGAVKSLIYVLKTGTETSKQNAACALLSLALIEENKLSIGASGAIPPLVALLINGSNRGQKDALTTLYKLCTVKLNKERAVNAGAVGPLVGLVGKKGIGLAEKAMVVLSSLAGIEMGRDAIMDAGGMSVLIEAVENGSDKGKEFAVLTLMQLCGECAAIRGLLVKEGGIPPLVSLSQTGTVKARHKAATLLGYLKEPMPDVSSSSQ
ncbi:U-box domain-containing protein 4-like [Andrographis paniculata]|uniref:U-box domain-containing protein 4-like n=1 Tax=Andrographis paniculata TaxID=175694 RepID=UPI0021E9405A|nr:U-box domain-containing protein 4-like [Andrographis paniculata]